VIDDAIDTTITLGWALLAWITALAAIGTLLLLATTAAIAWLWQHLRHTTWTTSTRHTPHPARPDYDEAA